MRSVNTECQGIEGVKPRVPNLDHSAFLKLQTLSPGGPPRLLSVELAQLASNTHYSVLGTEEPAVTNQPGSTFLEVTVMTAGYTPTRIHSSSSHASETLADPSLGAEALASPRGLLEMKKTTSALYCNQIPR